MQPTRLPSDERTFSLLDELIQSVEHGGPQERLRILRRVTDLFMAGARGFSSEQIAIFDDIFQELIAELEAAARERLAHAMAKLERAPRGLLRSLAFDDNIAVAAPLLIHSRELSDDDLLENARSKSQAHLLAIAQRLELSEVVTDVLIERGDTRVVRCVTRNSRARISLPGYDRLIVRAREDRILALTVADRRDLPRQCYIKLIENASASVRERLQSAHPEFAGTIEASLDDLASRLQQQARALSDPHRIAARKMDKRLRTRKATEADVHAAASVHDFEKTALALAGLGEFPIEIVERALLDRAADPVLVLAKAAGCAWVTARELLELRDAERHCSPEDLRRYAEQYKKLKRETARNILRFREQRLRSNVIPIRPGIVPAAQNDPAEEAQRIASR
jgi:uncharacterized protein (DUF2336 family)